jgi:hypothetical protein
MILSIAGGSTAKEEIQNVLIKYAAMKQRWQTSGIDMFLDFFEIGMYSF